MFSTRSPICVCLAYTSTGCSGSFWFPCCRCCGWRNELAMKSEVDMLGRSIKLDKALWAKVKKVADAGGYSSPQEFVEHIIEKELAKLEEGLSDDEIAKKLQGLGYLD